MATKTFQDLQWYNLKGRDDANIEFENGWGVHIWRDRKYHGQWTYGGSLERNGQLHYGANSILHPLQWKSYMDPDEVTEYMKQVQELEPYVEG